jgi:hypothetical protein
MRGLTAARVRRWAARISSVLDRWTIGVVFAAFHLIRNAPASGWESVMHSLVAAVTLPVILPDRMDTGTAPVAVQPARSALTFIVAGVVPPTTRGGSITAVPTSVLHVIE